MPCGLLPRLMARAQTPKYLWAEAELRSRSDSIKHIVDFYCEVRGFVMPNLSVCGAPTKFGSALAAVRRRRHRRRHSGLGEARNRFSDVDPGRI